MTPVNSDLSTILAPYKTGWMTLNKQQTEVVAHANSFKEINEKVDNPDEVILSPVMRADLIPFIPR